jgi:hypothetical protein
MLWAATIAALAGWTVLAFSRGSLSAELVTVTTLAGAVVVPLLAARASAARPRRRLGHSTTNGSPTQVLK